MPNNFTIADVLKSACAGRNQHLLNPGKVKGKSKYGNKKVEFDGYVFDSKKECVRYQALKVLEITGEISDLKLHVSFDLPGCRYEADFVYMQDGRQIVEDVKSPSTRKNRIYRLKNKLMKEVLNITIIEI